jgi:hypothetical protein
MGWATSEQCLELLADDTPESYRDERNRFIQKASKHAGLGLTSVAGAAAISTFIDGHPLLIKGISTAVVLTGAYQFFNAYACSRLAREAHSFIAKAGTSHETYWIHPHQVRKHLYSAQRDYAYPIAAYNDLADIPRGQLGLVNAVECSQTECFLGYKRVVLDFRVQTRQGKASMRATYEGAELAMVVPEPPLLFVAQRQENSYEAAFFMRAISIDQFYRFRRVPAAQRRTDLAWMPDFAAVKSQ